MHVNVPGIDYVNVAIIISRDFEKVLLVDHKKLGFWVFPGGHIGDEDKMEDTDQALYKEIEEETGLTKKDIRVMEPPGRLRLLQKPDRERLPLDAVEMHCPWGVEIHAFPGVENHRHLCLIYLVKSKKMEVRLEERSHNAIKWFSIPDLYDEEAPKGRLPMSIKNYALQALTAIQTI